VHRLCGNSLTAVARDAWVVVRGDGNRRSLRGGRRRRLRSWFHFPSLMLPIRRVGSPCMSLAMAALNKTRVSALGLAFLLMTSLGWGFNWPATKYLLAELPPLTLRGVTGIA